jgi:excisionase family DNA binding protein
MNTLEETVLYTVTEVANFLKLSVLTIYKYIREQKLEAIEFGGHYRVSKTSLDTFITNHKVAKSEAEQNLDQSNQNEKDPNLVSAK